MTSSHPVYKKIKRLPSGGRFFVLAFRVRLIANPRIQKNTGSLFPVSMSFL